jgi:transposase
VQLAPALGVGFSKSKRDLKLRAHGSMPRREERRERQSRERAAMQPAAMAVILENPEVDLMPRTRNLIDGLLSEWKLVEQQIEELNDELERISAADAGCTRIRQIHGIGPVVVTAIVAAIGNGAAFRKGREFATTAPL